MIDNELLTDEGMDKIAEWYECTMNNNKSLVDLIKKKRDQDIVECLKTLENYAMSENDFQSKYLISLLRKAMV